MKSVSGDPLVQYFGSTHYLAGYSNVMGTLHYLEPGAKLLLDARIGYRSKYDKPSDWKLLAESLEERILECHIDEPKDGYPYQCELIPLFELGSLHHDFYLINIRLPVTGTEHNKVNCVHITTCTVVG